MFAICDRSIGLTGRKKTNAQVNSPTEWLVMVQSDDIGGGIRAISGISFAESHLFIAGVGGLRWVVGRAPKKKWRPTLRSIKLPNSTGCRDRCGLGALVGYTVGLVGGLHRCRVIRSARTWGENEGLYCKGRKRHSKPELYSSAAFGTSESQIKTPKDPSGGRWGRGVAERRFILAWHFRASCPLCWSCRERANWEQGHGGSFQAHHDELARRDEHCRAQRRFFFCFFYEQARKTWNKTGSVTSWQKKKYYQCCNNRGS